MATLAELQTQLEALKKARRSGLLEASYDGKRAQYRSDAEMQAAIAATQVEIDALLGNKPQLIVVRSSKGW